MQDSKQIAQLSKITNAVFQADLARLQAIATEEARLRAAQAELQAVVTESAALEPLDTLTLKQLGGDLLWKAWTGRKREDLNLKLAAVMARKLHAQDTLRRSFGKAEVARTLEKDSEKARRESRALKTLANEQAQMVQRATERR